VSERGAEPSTDGHSGTIVAIVLLGIMIAGLAYRYWPSDEREIRRHLSNLAEALSVPGAETDVARMTRVAAMREYFAPDVRMRVGSEQIVSRDALMAAIARLSPPPGGVAVEFTDVTVALAQDHASADVTLTAKIASTDRQSGEKTLDVQGAAVQMRDADGDWVITSVEPREIPPRP
jgi:SnoaL-like domain